MRILILGSTLGGVHRRGIGSRPAGALLGLAKTHIIVNPASAAGKTGKRLKNILKAIEERLKGSYSLYVTGRPREATQSAKTAIEQGANLVIAIGGDGTVQEVVNGFPFEQNGGENPCHLGIVCSGTAQDFAKSFGLPRLIEHQVDIVCGDHSRRVDVGRVSYIDLHGRRAERFFINECQPGIAAVVVERVSKSAKRLGGFLGFGLAAVATIARHRDQVMAVTIDDRETVTGPLLGVVVANGSYAGGGMNFAPRAKVDDGLFDVVLIHGQRVISRLVNFPKIYTGKHVDLSWVSYQEGKRVSVTSEEQVLLEADGELLGYLPCSIQLLPRALQIKTSPGNSNSP